MKKIFVILMLLVFTIPCFAAQWFEIFEKQYIDLSTIQVDRQNKIVRFWVKSLRKDPNDKILDKDYWYSMDYWALSCKDRKTRIEDIAVYDLKGKIIYSDSSTVLSWNKIIPDTYADGYYRVFCIASFEENPLLQHTVFKGD